MSNTIYSHISENKRDTAIIIAMFPLSLFILMFLLFFIFGQKTDDVSFYDYTYQTASMVASFSGILTLSSIIWILFVYFFGDKLVLSISKANELSKKDNPTVYRLVENIAITAGLPTPKICIIEDNALNAFATGRNPETSTIVLTSGIIKKLDKQELEGVIAHEMSHIGNHDVRTMLLIVAGIGFFTFLGSVLLRFASSSRISSKKNGDKAVLFLFVIAIGLLVFGYIIAPLIRLALSRKREYQADATAALITRNPIALANALQKISQASVAINLNEVSAMCIENPIHSKISIFGSLSGLFSTHPPVEKRIEALRLMGK